MNAFFHVFMILFLLKGLQRYGLGVNIPCLYKLFVQKSGCGYFWGSKMEALEK
jgi:hypothetical protein